ncbi:alkanesulfonate monooxygenase SsuD/methylene tetrahydromethanopterin reductase-like flavin-dependent oxidoreductase (luciferase family) [Murinocardiopsis flavida]|uniref:Alkanesulfonate monooxygenase SsuD/methylene tetrahydromethanopterin reductase-like flavin-dependent oxidoreductase (Luciferase family) n=1 Tax=Murinocardiopsis flavida TaxID=645275 RepID=A0A2P8D948_9ACTN|nr:LLM class flavin-dependent oxidoreductase [Murinocardiopsis flavida]PSK93758.1 alkanesulfonate monooxygenase SsuD/methylene tetrahydromethanopterin reductase-like flavin-dependent oxidoreductase (luciferase family) [Murinocardiopsis flavida]
MPTIKIGTGPPMAMDERAAADAPAPADAARLIEESGLESLWVPDLLIGDGTPALEPALTLAAAAAATERVKIGFSVLVVPLRPAPWLAAQVATLQHLSGDRLLLGVGSGGFPDAPFWQALGVPAKGRGRATDAALAMLPDLLAGRPVTVADGAPPLTLAPPAALPPVLVGGSEHAFTRVLDHGHGWFPSLISPADLAPAAARLRERAAERGQAPPTVTVGGHLALGTGPDARAAHDALVRMLVADFAMAPEAAEHVPMTARTPAELADIYAAYQDAGADRVVAGADNGDWRTQLDFIAEARALLA